MIATVTPNPCIDYMLQVDELLKNALVRAKGSLMFPGGVGVNAARTIQLLGGIDVKAYGFAGGPTGQLLKSLLDADGVAHDFIDTGLSTRINVLTTLIPDRSLVRVNAAGPECDESHGTALLKQLLGLDPVPTIVVLGGSLPGRKLPPPLPRDYYARVIDDLRAKKPAVKVILDSSDMPLGHGVDKGPYLVRCSQEELGRLAGRRQLADEAEIVAAAEGLIKKYGVEYFVVSRGADGSVVVGKAERHRITPGERVSLTRVAAGDAVTGGLAWALAKGQTIAEAARVGTAVGTAAVLSPAASLFRTAEVEALLAKTTIDAI